MTVLVPAEDASPADWIVESLTVFGLTVTGLVPAGFEAYVRIFHPAQRDGRPLRWAEIAAEHGRVAHAVMSLGGITGRRSAEMPTGREFWDRPPELGTLPTDIGLVLVDVLRRHTRTPDLCWFALWNGFANSRDRLKGVPTFTVPARDYFLLSGRLEQVTESLEELRAQSANLWWPDDHAWCVATEIDLRSTYLGCSRPCADELLARVELEAYEIEPTAGAVPRSDEVNQPPEFG